mmetsp:Transcript_33897/g.54917  ORF Transcript_33897/g.54917 Transcript_33897/m.54917 type:complete len:503 (+) Transcript_33897:167-1675(+)
MKTSRDGENGAQISIHEFLSKTPPSLLEAAEHRSGTSVTKFSENGSEKRALPKALRKWESFPDDVASFLEENRETFSSSLEADPLFVAASPPDDEYMILNSYWKPHIAENISRVLEGTVRKPFGVRVLTRPDLVYVVEDEVRCVFELKTFWAFDYGELIGELSGDLSNDDKLCKVVMQVYSQMSVNKLKYGVMSTYNKTWFFKRPGPSGANIFEVYGPVLATSEAPFTHFQALKFLLERDDYRHHSTFSSPSKGIKLRLRSAESFPTSNDSTGNNRGNGSVSASSEVSDSNRVHDSPSKLRRVEAAEDVSPSNLELDISPDDLVDVSFLGEGRCGSVVRTVIDGTLVAVKVIDLMNVEGAWDELRNEVEAYKLLEGCQGDVVPSFYGSSLYGPLGFLVMEVIIGDPLSDVVVGSCDKEDMYKKALHALQAVHEKGVLHGDIRLENFILRRDGKVVLLDFGHCGRVVDYEDESSFHQSTIAECKELNQLFKGVLFKNKLLKNK